MHDLNLHNCPCLASHIINHCHLCFLSLSMVSFFSDFPAIEAFTIAATVTGSSDIDVTWEHDVSNMSYVLTCSCIALNGISDFDCQNDSSAESSDRSGTCGGLTPGNCCIYSTSCYF